MSLFLILTTSTLAFAALVFTVVMLTQKPKALMKSHGGRTSTETSNKGDYDGEQDISMSGTRDEPGVAF